MPAQLLPSFVRASRLWGALLVILIAAAAACAGSSGASDDGGAPEKLSGVVLEVRSEGLGDVRGFTLKSGDETYEVAIDPDRDYSFPPAHLSDHLASGDPVRVELEARAGKLYATAIEDA
ncbi:MAG: hypothetical protein ABR529_02400 [Actinomycetota bacterium]